LAAFMLGQSARTGALSFSSEVEEVSMPGIVLTAGVNVDAALSDRWGLRVGHGGMALDGRAEHGVTAGLRIRF